MVPPRSLLLLRHAKSSWDDPSLRDHDRPLSPRGKRATLALRNHLESIAPSIHLVLCSTARRTVETWEGIAPAFVAAPEVVFDIDLYGASAHRLLAAVRDVPDTVAGLLVIAHNPGIEDLAGELTGTGDPETRSRLHERYPTGGLATLMVTGSWGALDWGDAELVDFVLPRDLPGGH